MLYHINNVMGYMARIGGFLNLAKPQEDYGDGSAWSEFRAILEAGRYSGDQDSAHLLLDF
jgi:hypothetical protein